ncbi:MAG: Adaptive-response sensory-kinase SasA [Candidatus Methanoperedenaceae archaeon GB50]|nr:MAG: Adaptive-response sensory-kinase SasA [Candidatus Methanoperedenaceae archaeon GB50]
MAEDIKSSLEALGYKVCSIVATGEDAVKQARRYKPDLVLMDIILRGKINGIEAANQITSLYHIPVVYLTAYADKNTLQQAKVTQPYGYIIKPFTDRELYSNVEIALYKSRMERKIKHLNAVLRAIRNVSQLVTTEKDPDRLLKGACESLIGTRGYHSAWIVLWNENGKLVTAAEAGLGDDFLKMIELLKDGKLPICGQRALFQSDIVVTSNPFSICTNCPLAGKYKGRSAMTVRLEHEGKIYGMLTVSIPRELAEDKEEQELFKELAGDLAFALYSIEVEEKRKQAEEKLRESEEKYRSLVEFSEDHIYLVDRNCNYLFMNSNHLSRLGLKNEQFIGKPYSAFHTPQETENFAKKVKQVLKTNKSLSYEYRSVRDDKYYIRTLSPVKDPESGEITAITVISKDITQRKQAEERLKIAYHKLKETQNQLIQHEKMAAMGRLASGFAHEIRNPLAIILMGIESLSTTLPEKNEIVKKTIEKIKQAVNRANKIIIDTLQFSRMSEFKFESIDICKSLDETIDLIKHKAVLNNIKINRNYPQKHMRVKADKNMLQQVFLNLFMNAMDAMPKGGEIKVRVYDKIANQLGYKIGERESDYFKIGDKIIVVEIEDTGIGIPKNILSKIFDPFFTTKKVGEGTGLGLSVVHLIIDQHRGIIDVESEVNKGTKFIITLPAKNLSKEGQYNRDEKHTFK